MASAVHSPAANGKRHLVDQPGVEFLRLVAGERDPLELIRHRQKRFALQVGQRRPRAP
jgi:hypothetical protein